MDISKNIIVPQSQKQITHSDLVKFGVDSNSKPKQNEVKNQNISNIQSVMNMFAFPDISYILNSNEWIEVIRKRKKLLVDRKTGLKIKSHKNFKDIYKFDIETLPDDEESVNINTVSYWNNHNRYIEAKI